tara:strand:+ start:16 stop:213 length:198 start_codon:yes stop_codon:yes gene_type:complete
MGDGTTDDAEYKEAENNQSLVENRTRSLEHVLSEAEVSERPHQALDTVSFGSTVAAIVDDDKKNV